MGIEILITIILLSCVIFCLFTLEKRLKLLKKQYNDNDAAHRRIIARQDEKIKQLNSEIKRLNGWLPATFKNTTYNSRFRYTSNHVYGNLIINRDIKILHRIGVTFEGAGFIPFEQLEVFGV